jgi:hypothetical protein
MHRLCCRTLPWLSCQVPVIDGKLDGWQFECLMDVLQTVLLMPLPQVLRCAALAWCCACMLPDPTCACTVTGTIRHVPFLPATFAESQKHGRSGQCRPCQFCSTHAQPPSPPATSMAILPGEHAPARCQCHGGCGSGAAGGGPPRPRVSSGGGEQQRAGGQGGAVGSGCGGWRLAGVAVGSMVRSLTPSSVRSFSADGGEWMADVVQGCALAAHQGE